MRQVAEDSSDSSSSSSSTESSSDTDDNRQKFPKRRVRSAKQTSVLTKDKILEMVTSCPQSKRGPSWYTLCFWFYVQVLDNLLNSNTLSITWKSLDKLGKANVGLAKKLVTGNALLRSSEENPPRKIFLELDSAQLKFCFTYVAAEDECKCTSNIRNFKWNVSLERDCCHCSALCRPPVDRGLPELTPVPKLSVGLLWPWKWLRIRARRTWPAQPSDPGCTRVGLLEQRPRRAVDSA